MKISTVTATGSQWKSVTCEKCKHVFAYKMTRTGSWSESRLPNPFGVSRAELPGMARLLVRYKLEHATESVPCPACGRYQRNMITPVRYRPGWMALIVAVALVMLVTIIDLALTRISIPAGPSLIGIVVLTGVAYKLLAVWCEHLTEQSAQQSYERLNAHPETNKQKAAELIRKGLLRSENEPVQPQ